jgi:hypothetical protein
VMFLVQLFFVENLLNAFLASFPDIVNPLLLLLLLLLFSLNSLENAKNQDMQNNNFASFFCDCQAWPININLACECLSAHEIIYI